jgi:hypothetical protein
MPKTTAKESQKTPPPSQRLAVAWPRGAAIQGMWALQFTPRAEGSWRDALKREAAHPHIRAASQVELVRSL